MLSIVTWFAFHALILAAGAAIVVALRPPRESTIEMWPRR
jgi:hypothetical protein